MARLLAIAMMCCLCALTAQAAAHDFNLSLDLRAVSSDATQSRLTGGLGATRFSDSEDGLQLGLVRIGYRGDVTDTLQLNAEAVSYGSRSEPVLDLTEAYVEWRPIPDSAWRSKIKVGAFYPEISLENRLRGWRSPYTISSSAINTWVGEELRTLGAEYTLDWLGRKHGHDVDAGISVAAFGWNDPAGTVIASRGWGLHDQQTTLFGTFGKPHQLPLPERTLVYDDLDKRVGYHVAAHANYRGVLELTALRYDNRADSSIYSKAINDVAWLTQFDSVGVRWQASDSLTFIWQRLYGRTYAGGPSDPNCWSFSSAFVLASWQAQANRYSLRYDRFTMNQVVSNYGFYDWERGHAWTLAYTRSLGEHWNVIAEALQVDSGLHGRILLGLPVAARERQLQLAVRYEM